MTPRTPLSPLVGGLVGLLSAAPFAYIIVGLAIRPEIVWMFALPCLVSGAISGATFGRHVAARPGFVRIAVASGLAALIGALLEVAAWMLFTHSPVSDIPLGLLNGLTLYGLPVYFLVALPSFCLGVVLARRIPVGRRPAAAVPTAQR
jgi:hypothetical protein